MTLPDRRIADGDRREKPGVGYGNAMSLDPDNRRIVIRRSWKKNRGIPQPIDEKALHEFLSGFSTEGV